MDHVTLQSGAGNWTKVAEHWFVVSASAITSFWFYVQFN